MKRRLHTTHLIVCCWLLAAVGAFAQTPVASYNFSGSAKDQSSFANHASVHGANLTQDRFGWANSAFLFDGSKSGLTANNAAQLNSANTTISFWVKPNSFPAQAEAYLLSFGGYQERWKISLPNHGKPVFTTHSGGVCCSDLDGGTPLTIGAWTHVVMVHDGAQDIIYYNGVQVNIKTSTGALDTTTKPLGIGYDPINNDYSFDGALDEVEIFDVALSSTQIAALYATQNTPPTVAQGVVANYTFSGNGTDATTFANTANLAGAELTTDRFGYGNSALLVDGNSTSVTASNAAQLNSATTTITFWIKPAAFPVNGEAYLLSFGGYQDRFKISLPNHGKPVFTTHSGGVCCSDLDSGTPLALNTWTQVVMVHDGAKDIIYFNGVKVNDKASVGSLDSTTKPLGIGFDPIGNTNWFNGALDDISIYNFALSAGEIASLYTTQSTFPGTATDLVASYSLNGNGKDATQFGNTAELDSAATATTNRFGWASNALKGAATADNSIALQSDYTTIGFWINPASFPAQGESYLLSEGGYQERWKISLPNHGKPVFTTHAGGVCCSDLDSGTPLALNTWTYVTMVHDGAKDIIYFNGVQVSQKTSTGALDKTKYPLGIGYDPINNSNFFDTGSLDDIEIYNRALSATEIAALYAAQNVAPTVGGNLVADYKASGNANDATAYGNNAVVNGAQLTTDRFNKANQAYSFDGVTQSLLAANSPQLNSPFTTISFWVNPKSLPASGEVYLLSHGGYQERWKISLPNHGKPVFTTHAGGVCCSDLDSGTPLVVGTWTHVVMVHDGAKDIIYFNGVKVSEKTSTGNLDTTTKPLGIGYDPIGNGNYFNGSLDEIEIYNVALSAAEIATLYANESQPVPSTDNEAPCAPLNLAATVVNTSVTLNWDPAMDNVGVVAYNVYQNGVLIATTSDLAATLANLAPQTDFVFGVSAVDAAGNESLITTLDVTSGEEATPDVTPPTAPGNLAGSTGAHSVLLTWDASTDDRAVFGYVVTVDGNFVDSLDASATSVLVNGLDPQTPYSFEIYAFDKAGNNSDVSELTLTTDQEINTGEAGLVAWYPFEGNANDATPYANHGVIGGNPVFEPATHPNGGGQDLKFDGDKDSVLVPNAVQLISDYTTVSFWIRVDGTNTADAEAYVLDFGHWSHRWKISLPQHHKIVWTTNGNNAQFPVFIHDMDSGDGNELTPGFWWYVTMVHDGVNDIIYINGEQVNSLPTATKLNSTSLPFGMGSNPVEGGQYFIGALDEVKMYNKALTAEEIGKLYSTGTTATKDGLTQELQEKVHSVYPSPAVDQVWVKHSFDNKQSLLVRVSDVQGRQVGDLRFNKNEIPAGKFPVNVSNYAPGTYFLNFVVDGKSIGSVKFDKK